MNEPEQTIAGETGHKYFTSMLNMAEDDLDPFQYRLLAHYLRWAGHGGAKQESIKETAKVCRMSENKVRSVRTELVELGYLILYEPTMEQRGEGISSLVEVLDRWTENIQRYAHKPPQSDFTEVEADLDFTEPPQSDLREPRPEPQLKTSEPAQLNFTDKYLKELKEQKNTTKTSSQPANANGVRTKRASPFEAEHHALIAAFGFKNGSITKTADILFWKVASELHAIRFPVEDIPALHGYVTDRARREQWKSTFGVGALSKYAPDFVRDRASPLAVAPAYVSPGIDMNSVVAQMERDGDNDPGWLPERFTQTKDYP